MTRALKQFLVNPAHIGALLAALLVAPLTATAASVKIDASGLGAVDAAIRFCIGVDPRDTRQFQQLEESLVGNSSDRQLDAMRATAQYQQTYSLLSSVLSGAPHDWAVSTCTNIIATSNGHDGTHDNGSDKNQDKGRD